MSFYSVKEMKHIRDLAREYKLRASDSFWVKPLVHLTQCCNGCGPERWPEILRRGLTKFLQQYAAAFAVHDWEYSEQTERRNADLALLENMKKIFARECGYLWFLSAKKRAERAAIYVIYACVCFCGDTAYDAAKEEKGEA